LRSSNSYRNQRNHLGWAGPGGRRRLMWIAFLAAASIRIAYGVDPNRAMSQYVRDQWGTEQGFPHGAVYAITQTTDGYLWIGTEAGLVRFDGWNFRLIKDDTGVVTIGSVLGLTEDLDGCLWIGMQDLTIVRYCKSGNAAHEWKPRAFDIPPSAASSYPNISAMTRGERGELLIARMEIGAFGFRGGRFQLLASAAELPRSPVISLAQTPNGDVWVGTRDAGLFRLSDRKTQAIRDGLPDLKINCLLADGDRGLWVGTDNGIARWDGGKVTTYPIPGSAKRFQALAMVKDRDGNIWVGTDSRGLLRLNAQGFASHDEHDAEQDAERDFAFHYAITALFEDREGNLWIGRAGSLERLRDSAFVTYSQPEGLPTDGSNPVFADSENRMWFGPVDGGLWWVRGGMHGAVTSDGLERDVVYSIAGRKGELWVGRQQGGLTRLQFARGSIAAKTYTQAEGLAQNSVYSVYLARDGGVWAGTLSAGVSVLRDGRFINYTTSDGLASNTVASILESSGGTMWFATPGGLSALLKGSWRTYTARNGLPSDNVNCLLEDSTGAMWAGTGLGLAVRGPDGFEVPRNMPALLRAPVLGIAEDRYGSLWIATSDHVLRLNRDKLLHGSLAEGDWREYGLADGLRGVEGVKRHRSVVTDATGRVWFSLNRGISVADPARETRDSAAATVHIQTISTDRGPIEFESEIRIPGGRHRTTFNFVGISLLAPERVRYKYRLEGFDRAWSEPAATREAVYTNLPPGSYRFRVMASNPDGVWSANEADIAFEVAPLFWQTWWFRMSAILLGAITVAALYQLRLHQHTRRLSLRFQERLAERTRIAQELHDTLLQGFLSASMQVHVAADGLPDDSSVKPTLNRALELMRQVIDEGRNAVRGLRSSRSASLDLEQAFSRIPQELVSQGEAGEPVDFRVIVDGEQKPLHPVLRDEVYRIGREALVNAFHHARAKRIEIELKYSSRDLRVVVRDNGCGIDPGILRSGRDGHWGLSGMRERAEEIGARLHVFSSAAAGTEIELSIPGHVAFQNQSESGVRWFRKRHSTAASGQKPIAKNGNKT